MASKPSAINIIPMRQRQKYIYGVFLSSAEGKIQQQSSIRRVYLCHPIDKKQTVHCALLRVKRALPQHNQACSIVKTTTTKGDNLFVIDKKARPEMQLQKVCQRTEKPQSLLLQPQPKVPPSQPVRLVSPVLQPDHMCDGQQSTMPPAQPLTLYKHRTEPAKPVCSRYASPKMSVTLIKAAIFSTTDKVMTVKPIKPHNRLTLQL